MKYLNPKADLTFKRVFGEHPDLVKSLLNALLPLAPDQEIEDIEYLSPEMVPETPLRKDSIVDVRCKDKKGRQFIVEMQMIWTPEFKQRVLFNASKAYVRQVWAGEHYELLQPVYSLNLVNDIFEPSLEGYYHHYTMIHVEHSDRVIDGLQLIFVELPKFNPQTYSEKKMQVLWLRYLTEINEYTKEAPEELLANPDVNKALVELQQSAFSEAQLLGYERFWDMVNVERLYYRYAERRGTERGMRKGLRRGLKRGLQKGLEQGMQQGMEQGLQQGMEQGLQQGMEQGLRQGLEQGLQKGIEEGMQQGIEQGRQQGLEQGRQQGLEQGIEQGLEQGRLAEQQRIAFNMKKQGVPTDIIAQSTGLPILEIDLL